MSVDVNDKADNGKERQDEGVDGDNEYDEQQYRAFGPGFDEMKGIGGPGGRVGRAMM